MLFVFCVLFSDRDQYPKSLSVPSGSFASRTQSISLSHSSISTVESPCDRESTSTEGYVKWASSVSKAVFYSLANRSKVYGDLTGAFIEWGANAGELQNKTPEDVTLPKD